MFVLVLCTKLPVIVAMRQLGGYDNHHPREQQSRLTGWGARALGAHKNSIEAFAPFAAGVWVAQSAGLDARRTGVLCVTFLILRLLYVGAYLADLDYLRTSLWVVAVAANLGLFVLPMLG